MPHDESSSLRIQQAAPSDLDAGTTALLEAMEDYLLSLYPEHRSELLQRGLDPDLVLFVARVSGRPSGCAGLVTRAGASGEIQRLFVHPEARRRGLARALLARIEQHARGAGLRVLRLETGIRQRSAIALYESCGYDVLPDDPESPALTFFEKRL